MQLIRSGHVWMTGVLLCLGLAGFLQAGARADESSSYLVVDVSAGPAATSYPVSYLKDVPAGGWSDEYKTTKVVLRNVKAGAFVMGSPESEFGRFRSETQHQVTLSQDFYIGVFEVSQAQWERVMGDWPSFFNNKKFRASRPVEQVSYADIRGAVSGAQWPSNSLVDAPSFMGRLRARTGKAFDLPTEAQWEYACRAGTTTSLNSGKDAVMKDGESDPNLAEVGRYFNKDRRNYFKECSTIEGTAKVGSYQPNAWGLFDMHGNAHEWCLDWFGTYPGKVTDPQGAQSGTKRVLRGACWRNFVVHCRSAGRSVSIPGSSGDGVGAVGFRIALPSGQPGQRP